eukprot:PhF_6_TR30547/c0_g1_i1/m.44837
MEEFSVCERFYFDRIRENDPDLKVLPFHTSGMTDINVPAFNAVMKNNTNVTTVHLRGNKLTANGIREMSEMLRSQKSITHIDLSGNTNVDWSAADRDLQTLFQQNHYLKTLDVGDAEVSPELKELIGFNHIPLPLKLWVLSARRSDAIIPQNTNSTTAGCEVADFSQRPQRGAPEYTEACLQLFVTSVREYPRCVRVLDFSYNNVGDERTKELSKILSFTTTIVEVRLKNNNITSIGATALATSLQTNESVTELDLTNNVVGDKGVQAFVASIKRNRCALSYVHVQYNNISPPVLETFVTTLMYNAQPKALKSIFDDLMTNNIRVARVVLSQYEEEDVLRLNDASVRLLVKALVGNTSVTYVDLANNKISDDGAEQICHLLKNNNKLRTLVLDRNHIGEKGAKFVIEGVRYNSSLDEITLDNQQPPLPQSLLSDLDVLVSMNKHPIVLKKQGGMILDNDPSLLVFDISSYDGVRRCTERTLKILGETLKKNRTIRELYLGNNGGYATRESISDLVTLLTVGPGPSLVALHLENNRLNDTIVPVLCTFMETSRTLKTLNLSQNEFADDVERFIPVLTDSNHTVIELNLTKNPKVPAAVMDRVKMLTAYNTQRGIVKEALLRAERNDPSLTEINLVEYKADTGATSYRFSHQYNDKTVQLLSFALARNTFVVVLDLTGNDVTDEGMRYLADMLVQNRALVELRLNDNRITDVGFEFLTSAALQNRSLKTVIYDRNPISKDNPCRKKLHVALSSNANVKESVLNVFDGSEALSYDQMQLIDNEILKEALTSLKKS